MMTQWPKAGHDVNGWAIGEADDERDDVRDAKNVLDVIENEVLPAWDEGDERWCEIMRASNCNLSKIHRCSYDQ